MAFTDLFINRPVLAMVVSLLILAMGLRALSYLPIRQYPFVKNSVITVSTTYIGADPETVAGFITTPLEASLSQANGIDYMTSESTQGLSSIYINLELNYDPNYALADVTSRINATLNQLPPESQLPVVDIAIGETIDAMYIGFYSTVLATNQISDYLLRVVQPKLQTINGVQRAEILGNRQFAMRAWLDSNKLAGYGLTPRDVGVALQQNNFISAVGRTDGQMFTVNLTASTGLSSVEEFRNLIIRANNNTIIRLKDVAQVTLGARDYETAVSFNGQSAVYIGIKIAPTANVLTVINEIRQVLPGIQAQLPSGLNSKIVFDSSEFVDSAVKSVVESLVEALVIVTLVVFLFLGSLRSVIIPVVAIPLSLIGAFYIMFLLNYSINLLTLLALVLAIGLVVDDAIIIVENIQRHLESGMPRLQAARLGAKELAWPIVAISIILIAVYVPIGFMQGLTGALFAEFSFTLAGAVAVSGVVALTLSPMMCSKWLKLSHVAGKKTFVEFIDNQFEKIRRWYEFLLNDLLDHRLVIIVFALIILCSNYFLFKTSNSELAPTEDQGIIISQLTTAPNATLAQTQLYAREVYKIYKAFPETERVFQLDGINGLNSSIIGMGLKPWDKRKRTSSTLLPLVQQELDNIAGAQVAAFQLPPLPGARGIPIQFVICSTEPFNRLNIISQKFKAKALETGLFLFLDTDLKIDKAQTTFQLDRDKIAEMGLTMQNVANVLQSGLSENYINYFNFAGRSYQVIPQIIRQQRLNSSEMLNYYFNTFTGQDPGYFNYADLSKSSTILLSTIASLKNTVVPESLNHFQQLNAATISAVALPGITMGQSLNTLNDIAKEILPSGYTIDYGGQSRQFVQESAALAVTVFFALVIIFLSLAALFESFKDPIIVLISVPLSICGAMIFISLGIGGTSLNIYTQVGLVTLIGLISKHGILIVQFANDLQREGKSKREAVVMAAGVRLRPILMTTAAMVIGVVPLLLATGAGALSRYNIGLVIASGISIGTLFTLLVVPTIYLLIATDHSKTEKGV